MTEIKHPACLYGGCIGPYNCSHCGWNLEENERRRKIPLTPDERGLRRKIVGRPAETEKEETA